jgi:hypothetical protein
MGRMLAKKIRRVLDEQAFNDIDVSKCLHIPAPSLSERN